MAEVPVAARRAERVIALRSPSLSLLELLVSGLALVVVLLLIVDIPTAGAT